MRLLLIIITGLLFTCSTTDAQNYTRSLGVRGGFSSGLLYRNYKYDYQARELMLSVYSNGMKITYLFEQFRPAEFKFADENMWLVYGFGAHAGWHVTDHYEIFFTKYYYENRMIAPLLGIDGLIGLEYHLQEFPLIFGADYKPFLQFSTRQFFNLNLSDVAFSVKYKF